jgi:monoamine oxidase
MRIPVNHRCTLLDNPCVFFVGEHLAISRAWIQGAIQTGLAATINILQAVAPQQTQAGKD